MSTTSSAVDSHGGSRVSGGSSLTKRPSILPLLTGLAVGLLTFLLVTAYTFTRPAQYTSRVALSGVPSAAATTTGNKQVPDFSAVVSANMASVTEYVHTEGVLKDITRQVPGSPSPGEVGSGITVELVPSSSLARISVSAPQERVASQLAEALAQKVIKANLIGPSARFRNLEGSTPSAAQTAPDKRLGLGLALIGGIILGLAAMAIHLMFRPRLSSRRQVARVLDDPSIAVLEVGNDSAFAPLRTLASNIEGIQAIPVGPGAAQGVSVIRDQLGAANVQGGRTAPVLLVARRGMAKPSDLLSSVALSERAGLTVLGVALV